MKKMLVVSALILYAGIAIGQTFQKDNVFTLHVMEVNLKPGVTMDQFLDVVYEEYIPALTEAFPDIPSIFLGGLRGEYGNQFGVLAYYESEEVLEKYWPESGVGSDLYYERIQIVIPAREKMAELADWRWVIWTTWKVDPTAEEEANISSVISEVDIDFSIYPNPFSDNIIFEYDFPEAGNMSIQIYNSQGQLVATPVNNVKQSGINKIHWNGYDNLGNPLKEGVYFVQLQTANEVRSIRKVIKLIK